MTTGLSRFFQGRTSGSPRGPVPAADQLTGAPVETSLDLTACDRETIHTPGRIQDYGFLLGLTEDWVVSHASTNVAAFTGIAAAHWLGQPLADLIDGDALHHLRNQVAMLFGPNAVQRCFALALIDGLPRFDIAVHRAGKTIVVEVERAVTDEREAASLVRAMVARLKHSSGLPTFLRDGARNVQALAGFERVMVYRFDNDGHGEVVAEALRGTASSYLGLHYPASDIPVQARALYLRSPFRIVADVAGETVAIECAADSVAPLDQSISVLRALSPVHIEYLKNMGVAASLSISIVVDGKLWGLFACHHSKARLPTFAFRTAAELFGEMFSMLLEGRLRREAIEHELRARALAALLATELRHEARLLTNPRRLGELVFDTIPADGLAVHIDGASWCTGLTPGRDGCVAIAATLSARDTQSIFSTTALASFDPQAAAQTEAVAGMLAIPLMRNRGDYLLLFRSEQIRTVQWAGEPLKRVGKDDRLMPRRSFAAWAETVRGTSQPFTAVELQAAEIIRVALLDFLVQSVGRGIAPDVLRPDGHDLLVADLNQRVHNILALIRGLISQTQDSAETAASFIATLDQRVQSLARAHDHLASERWGPACLTDMVSIEAAAHLGIGHDRVQIVGANLLVQPTAFTTLALVLHELMTNAVKHGALSDGGVVVVSWQVDATGDLAIDWIERGGPIVALPSRRGFGSTIIERSIPHDLGGAAVLDYPPAGFEARFRIPAKHMAGLSAAPRPTGKSAPLRLDGAPLAGLNVLLVEDTMIVAMDCEATLLDLGAAKVTVAASVTEALAAIGNEAFDVAVLDYNLGSENSIGIADTLAAKAIPFAFATGYDGSIQFGGHANAPVIGKPYGRSQLVPVFARLGFGMPTPVVRQFARPSLETLVNVALP